jgi:hypothetical protein
MAKKRNEQEQTNLTVRLDRELDFFIDDYARKHGTSKNGVLVGLARKLYQHEQRRILDLKLKMYQIQEYDLKLKALRRNSHPSEKKYIDAKLEMQALSGKRNSEI